MHILCSGVDTLYVGLYSPPKPGLFDHFEGLMLNARELQGKATFDIAGNVHQLLRAGGAWKWMLLLPGFWTLRLAMRSSGDPAPHIHAQLRSPLLWSAGARRAVDVLVETVVPAICASPDAPATQVSRVDICTDWTEWSPSAEQLTGAVRRAKFAASRWEPARTAREAMLDVAKRAALSALRGDDERQEQLSLEAIAERVARATLSAVRRAGTAAAAELTMANAEADAQGALEEYWTGQVYTGAVWGKGSQRGRGYRKDLEIIQASGKHWMFDVYVGEDRGQFQEGEREAAIEDLRGRHVWRLEFELHRQALRTWSIDTCEDLWPRLETLWRELSGKWLRVAVPTHSRTGRLKPRSLWDMHPEWQQLNEGWRGLRELPSLRRRIRQLSLERSQALSCLSNARIIALLGDKLPEEASFNPAAAGEAWLANVLEHLERRGLTWQVLIDDYKKRARRPTTTDAFSPPDPGERFT